MSIFFRCLLLLSLVGCASKHAYRGDYEEEQDYGMGLGSSGHGVGGGGYGRGAASKAPSSPAPAMARKRGRAARTEMSFNDAVVVDEVPQAEEGKEDTAQPRMVHYNGHIRLEVSRPSETIEAVVARAKEVGGFVERQTLTSASLRVPVDKFRETYDWILGQGDVLSRSMSARDVTDAHFALDLRMRTARKTRDRLQQLLARAQDENTKIALLKQIQRLTEQVDRMERQLKTLSSLASMSRLTLDAQSRSAMVGAKDVVPISGFEWIARLSPFSRAVSQRGKYFKLPTPEGLVALSDKHHFQAESADGVIFWTTRLDNRPEGSAEFWRAAIQERIGKEFASAELGQVGSYLTLRLVAPSESPYIYTLTIEVDDDELLLVETLYPSAEAEKRHKAQIEAVLGGGAS
jgi:hypothetical protein